MGSAGAPVREPRGAVVRGSGSTGRSFWEATSGGRRPGPDASSGARQPAAVRCARRSVPVPAKPEARSCWRESCLGLPRPDGRRGIGEAPVSWGGIPEAGSAAGGAEVDARGAACAVGLAVKGVARPIGGSRGGRNGRRMPRPRAPSYSHFGMKKDASEKNASGRGVDHRAAGRAPEPSGIRGIRRGRTGGRRSARGGRNVERPPVLRRPSDHPRRSPRSSHSPRYPVVAGRIVHGAGQTGGFPASVGGEKRWAFPARRRPPGFLARICAIPLQRAG